MDIPKLNTFQPFDDALNAIRSNGGTVGYVNKPSSGMYLFIIDQIDLGVLNIQDVGDDGYVIWSTQVPFDNHDTVGYIVQRAKIKAGI